MQKFSVKPHQLLIAVILYMLINIVTVIQAYAAEAKTSKPLVGNFGMPGIIDLPTGYSLPDGEIVFTQQVHESLARSGISFQALPKLGFAFRYSGHGKNGSEAFGRINHDRSFDAHITITDEKSFLPAMAIGLRDFIGTGWYSSEYIVGSKTIGPIDLSVGLGFGRLADRRSFKNPLSIISDKFENRERNERGMGGTFGTINWFQGKTAIFGGINFNISEKFVLSAEYTPDQMDEEWRYLSPETPWNFGVNYKVKDSFDISAQYLHGDIFSIKGNLNINPKRPIYGAGLELAPVPMLDRKAKQNKLLETNESIIRKVLQYDEFEILSIKEDKDTIRIDLINRKFRSVSQALGRAASTLQRFSKTQTKKALVVFHKNGLQVASYKINLDQVANDQYIISQSSSETSKIEATSTNSFYNQELLGDRFRWGIGPYFTHRFFNPDLPLSAEAGLEFALGFAITEKLKIHSAVRKSVITNLTKNKRLDSGSVLPRVHSDWGYYDLAGQDGHIHELTVSYSDNISNNFYGRIHGGFLEPHFAGFGGEILYKKPKSPLAIGLDIHHVVRREYDMLFDLRDYSVTTGHLSFYYDPGKIVDVELNVGRYLARDWGATTTISRRFSNGWEVAGYATFTEVPFEDFGEGSFDKGFYIKIPLDWILGSPTIPLRRFEIRPITRDGGARLGSSRQIYQNIKYFQNSQFQRERGRLWK